MNCEPRSSHMWHLAMLRWLISKYDLHLLLVFFLFSLKSCFTKIFNPFLAEKEWIIPNVYENWTDLKSFDAFKCTDILVSYILFLFSSFAQFPPSIPRYYVWWCRWNEVLQKDLSLSHTHTEKMNTHTHTPLSSPSSLCLSMTALRGGTYLLVLRSNIRCFILLIDLKKGALHERKIPP